MKLRRRYTGFVQSPEVPEIITVESLAQLYDIPFIRRIWLSDASFDHFAQSPAGDLLLAIMKDGRHWSIAWAVDSTFAELDLPHYQTRQVSSLRDLPTN